MSTSPRVDYQTNPSQYKHWKLNFEGPVATLKADFDENGGLRPGFIKPNVEIKRYST